jgi:hypothetical protein
VKFREHRGGLSESMATVIDVADRRALVAYVARQLEPFYFTPAEVDAGLAVEPYMYDSRIGWDTHIVTLKRYGVLGFTDGPCPQT